MRKLLLVALSSFSVQAAIAEEIEHPAESHSVVAESDIPQKVYVETKTTRRSISTDEENCFYNEEHAHIHCYENEQNVDENRSVRPSTRERSGNNADRTITYRTRDSYQYDRYRNDRYRNDYYDSSGLAIGLAIGIPWSIHNSHYDRYYSRSYYGHGSYYNHGRNYGNYGHRSNYRSHNRRRH